MLETLLNAWRLTDLRRKILFTFGMLVVFRFIAHVPVPGVDVVALEQLFSSNQLLGMLDLFSGGAMRNLSVAAMGVYPYITASIIMQLMVPVVPRLEALSKEGEMGRATINRYTHWMTVPLAALQAYGQLVLLQSQGLFGRTADGAPRILVGLAGETWLLTLAMVVSMTAGTVFLVWLGELITENGIGNGISVIIFGGIVAGLPSLVAQGLVGGSNVGLVALAVFVVLAIAIVAAIVFFQEAQRRIPVQYTR
ncbi:MAG: preprotein translocase subunit SecY, partial [Chloroflexi bacterium]|nr:preprotein translocase subunit SecY [Chloroflexota bacterium]